jgi:CelD/BcsL family acetyltransferase involved in cellulose biosynthesis
MSDGNISVPPRVRRVLDGPSIIPGVDGKSPPGSGTVAEVRQPVAVVRRTASDSREAAVGLELAGDLGDIEQDWRAFEQRADCTVFQTFDWLAAWQRNVGARRGARPAIFVARDSHGEMLFILPLAVEAGGAIRRLAWLGSDLCDYNAPLLAKNFTAAVSEEKFAALWREATELLQADPALRFDLIDLQKMPERVGTQTNPMLRLGVTVHPSGAYVAELGHDWEQFYAACRSAATRKKERRQLRHLAEQGEVRLVEAEDEQARLGTLDVLIGQKSHAFERMGVENIFARPGYVEFYRDLVSNARCSRLVHVSGLQVGRTIAAANLGLRFGDCYYLVLSSYQDGELARFGPGRAHLHELLRQAIERGFRRFDFTVGDEVYKRDWSSIEVRLWDHLAVTTLRGHVARAAVTAYRRAKRFVKQTPALWRVFSKARARIKRGGQRAS